MIYVLPILRQAVEHRCLHLCLPRHRLRRHRWSAEFESQFTPPIEWVGFGRYLWTTLVMILHK
jgi:hypothetical protein